jgi:tRNA (guanine37-N1)-methyltransferase
MTGIEKSDGVRQMKFSILTIFPEMIRPFLEHGIIRLAVEREQISISSVNIRDFAKGRHRVTDDRPYGGGCGMVMKPEPLFDAVQWAKKESPESKTILLSPQGRMFDQKLARELAATKGLILICGRYEGVDERICNHLIDDEISIGDYIMTGGELAAMIIIDAVTRLVPGILGGEESAEKDSFENGLLEHAHYTRPRIFNGDDVPDVLLSGNHKEIEDWRLESSLMRTLIKRPDLLQKKSLTGHEIEILKKWCRNIENIIRS